MGTATGQLRSWSLTDHGVGANSLYSRFACVKGLTEGKKSFHREGIVGLFYFGQHADVQVVTQHGWDSAWFGQGYGDVIDGVAVNNNTPSTTLPPGSRAPTWNGGTIEPHYIYSLHLLFLAPYETIRMSQQAG